MKVIIIGSGPAGLMAGIKASENGADVFIFDSNEKAGKKIYITGKGRCNVTNNKFPEEFLENVVSNPRFLYSAIYAFTPQDTISFFENNGIKLKTERGDRVFPESDKASDITKGLLSACINNGCKFCYNEKVISITKQDKFIVKTEKDKYECDKVIIATGGKSYQATGSTGDGYNFAKCFGHKIVNTTPALVPIILKDKFICDLEGISLKNVSLNCFKNGKKFKSLFGEMLFTNNGISGPIALSLSSYITKENFNDLELYIDFKPALDEVKLDARIQREIDENKNKDIKNIICNLLPQRLVKTFLEICEIIEEKKCNAVTQQDRKTMVKTLKNFPLKLDRLMDINCAIITNGGVDTKEINPKTMESKIVKGLYFAGEVIDVDALTGGYNIQIALSTGYLAGMSVMEELC